MTCKKIHSDYKAYSLLDPGKVETITLFSLQQEINHNIILSEIVNILYKMIWNIVYKCSLMIRKKKFNHGFLFLYLGSSIKVMGYSTFRHFLKDQFPNVRFHKDDVVKNTSETRTANISSYVNGFNVQNR